MGEQRPAAIAAAVAKRRSKVEKEREARMGRAELERTKARLDEIERAIKRLGGVCVSQDSRK